jgi:Tfp pilus assembly protein PilO
MNVSLKRIFEENRRLSIGVVAAFVVNVLVYAGVVYPLSARDHGTEEREAAAARELAAAQRQDTEARNLVQGRDRTDAALKSFYKDVLPANLARARSITYLRLAQLAEEHNLIPGRRAFEEPDKNREGTLSRLKSTMMLEGDYEDIRRFIYQVESNPDFIVIDSVSIAQGSDQGAPLTLTLGLSTYFRAGPDGV